MKTSMDQVGFFAWVYSSNEMPVRSCVDGTDLLIKRDLGAVHLPRGKDVGRWILEDDIGLVIAIDVLEAGKSLPRGHNSDLWRCRNLGAVHLPDRNAVRGVVDEEQI